MSPLDAAIAFYGRLRDDLHDRHSEYYARRQAELYLRRKIPGMDANAAAELLADALARRAAARLVQAESAIVQR